MPGAVSEENDRKAKPAPAAPRPATKTVLGMAGLPDPAADPSDLERTRELPPGSRIASAWPRPTPKSLRPGTPAGSPPSSALPRPSLGGDLFPGLPLSSRPPAPDAKGLSPAPSPKAAPAPPPSAEEISSSLLLPDDSGMALAAADPFEAEELSGSLLIEEPPDGLGPPVVTRLGPGAPVHADQPAEPFAPAEAAHRALLGMPELPRSTPGPTMDHKGRTLRPAQVFAQPAEPVEAPIDDATQAPSSDEPVHTDAGLAPGPAAFDEQASALPTASSPPPRPSDRVELPKGGLTLALEQAKERLGRLRQPSKELFDRLRAKLLASADEKGPGERPHWMLPAVTLAGLFVGVGLVALLFLIGGHGKGPAEGEPAQASTVALPSPSEKPAPSAPVASNPVASALASPPAAVTACTVAAPAHVVAATAMVASGVEVRPFGDEIALGFAPTDHEAKVMRIDPVSLAPTGGSTGRASDPIRRVRPVVAPKDSLGVAVDADRKRDKVHGRRTLPLDPPLQAGAFGADLVWTRAGGPPAGKLWSLASLGGADEIDALRAASEGAPGDTTTAIAFRKGNAILVGVATGYRSLSAKGELSRIEGLGTAIGSPAVAVSEGVVVVAWADRPSSDVPWRLRMVRMKAGDAAGEPRTFSPPPGGPGNHVMSPSLASVPGGRFLLVWTEGPTSHQRVRGITLSASGEPVGKALEISNEARNSGQGQAAVTAAEGAKGVVGFLQATDDGFEVAAAPIRCGS